MIDRYGVAAVLVGLAIAMPGRLLRAAPTVCPFRQLTGLPCPACGLTRSWQAAAHLQLADSLGYHPLGAVTLVGTAGIALAGPGRVEGVVRRTDVQVIASGIWTAAWLWRLRRIRAA